VLGQRNWPEQKPDPGDHQSHKRPVVHDLQVQRMDRETLRIAARNLRRQMLQNGFSATEWT